MPCLSQQKGWNLHFKRTEKLQLQKALKGIIKRYEALKNENIVQGTFSRYKFSWWLVWILRVTLNEQSDEVGLVFAQ